MDVKEIALIVAMVLVFLLLNRTPLRRYRPRHRLFHALDVLDGRDRRKAMRRQKGD